jgi:hypothetical protein
LAITALYAPAVELHKAGFYRCVDDIETGLAKLGSLLTASG